MLGRILFTVSSFCVGYGFDLSGENEFIFWTIMLLSYLGFEIIMERLEGEERIFSNPCVISSIGTFGILFGVSNFGCFGTDNYVFADGTFQDVNFVWMNRAMALIFLSAIIMWVGYGSLIGKEIASRLWKNRFIGGFLRKTYRLRWSVIWFCLLASILSRYIQISLGVFGYSSEIDQLYALAAYRQYLDLGVSLGRVGLAGVALAYFSGEEKSFYTKIMLVFFLIYEILFGFLVGFKGQTIVPLIIVGLCQYIVTGKNPKWSIFIAIIVLYFSYMIIEPFRVIRNSDESFQNRNIAEIGSTMWNIAKGAERPSFEESSYLAGFISSSGLIVEAARSIRFKEENDIPEGAPEFLRNILISPIYAFVPRFFWQSKHLANIGGWYAQVVHQQTTDTNSIGMSPIGYLYFTGGIIAVLVGFYFIGLLIRIFCRRFSGFESGGIFVFIGMLSMFIFVDSAVDSMFASVFRFFPLLILTQRFIFIE
jgi:hypothetical protein